MPFQPGRSGNPQGRPPKGQKFSEVLAEALDEWKNGKTTRQRIGAVVVEKALKGDLDAVKWITDRVDGRLTERVEARVDGSVTVGATDATLDAVLAYYAAKRGPPGGPS